MFILTAVSWPSARSVVPTAGRSKGNPPAPIAAATTSDRMVAAAKTCTARLDVKDQNLGVFAAGLELIIVYCVAADETVFDERYHT